MTEIPDRVRANADPRRPPSARRALRRAAEDNHLSHTIQLLGKLDDHRFRDQYAAHYGGAALQLQILIRLHARTGDAPSDLGPAPERDN